MIDEQGLIYSEDGKVLTGINKDLDEFDVEEIIIPEGVVDIEPFAFNSDEYEFELKFNKVKLPSTLERVGYIAFMVYGRSEVQFEGEFEHLTLYGGNGEWFETPVHVKRLTLESTYDDNYLDIINFKNWKHLEEVIIKSDVEECIFEGCENLRRVIFKGQCNVISKNAFAGCDKLEEINIPAETVIEEGAFDGKNTWRNRFVDLGLSSGTRWARINVGYSQKSPWGQSKNAMQWNQHGLLSCLPTSSQFSELMSLCSWQYESVNGPWSPKYNAYKITGLNGNSILLPVKNLVPGDNVAFYGMIDDTSRNFSSFLIRQDEKRMVDLDPILPCFLRNVYKPQN